MIIDAILTALLIPSMEMGAGTVWPAVFGLLGGFALVMVLDVVMV